VDNEITNKKTLQERLRLFIGDSLNWWELSRAPRSTDTSGFIYFAIISADTKSSHIKVGRTQREIKVRYKEHLATNTITHGSVFFSKYVASVKGEESSLISFLGHNGKLAKGNEEFFIRERVVCFIKSYLISSLPFNDYSKQFKIN
jgi:hypothetical protein